MRLPESRNRAAEDKTPIDQHRLKDGAPDRRGKIALNQVFKPQEIVAGAGLPLARLGLDGPGRSLAVRRALRTADRGSQPIQSAELSKFGPEHAVILRKTARIVSLHINDMAVLDAH